MSVEGRQVEVHLDFDLETYQAEWRRTSRERMLPFAESGEAARKFGSLPMVPPLEIVDHPDLLGRAWGWDRILPYNDRFPYGWSQYKKYLEEYSRNAPTALAHQTEANDVAGNHILDEDDGNGLAAYADSCIKMEGELMILLKRCPRIFAVDEGNLSNKITSCASQIKSFKCCEFPVATTALKCVKTEADLLFEIIITGAATPGTMDMSSKIRQCALSFMTYKGTEHIAAAAAVMMGAMTEANLMYELLKSGKHKEESSAYLWSYMVREWTLEALSRICSECCVMEECLSNGLPITRDKTAAELEFEKLSKEVGSLGKENEKQLNKEEVPNKGNGRSPMGRSCGSL